LIECIPILGNITVHKLASWLLSGFGLALRAVFDLEVYVVKGFHYNNTGSRSFLRINDGGEWQKFRYSTSKALNFSMRSKAFNFSLDFQKSQRYLQTQK